jgi:hypothetical protein
MLAGISIVYLKLEKIDGEFTMRVCIFGGVKIWWVWV